MSREEAQPMHLFDIRRSNSVIELWKRFENTSNEAPKAAEMTSDTSTTAEPVANNVQPENTSASKDAMSPAPAPEEDTQPLMAAFEAELSNLLKSSETSDTQAQESRAEPTLEPSANISSHGISPAVEQFMAQMLQQLCSGVGVMQTELRTRIPELRRQLSEAQRELPDNLATSLQAFFTHLEAQMRTAFNHLPENGRHMAEEAIKAGKPVAETAVESLRSFATDLDQSTRTLFAAFENEFGRAGPQNPSTTTGSSNAAPGVFFTPNSAPVPLVPSQESQIHSADIPTQQEDIAASGQNSVKDSGPSNATRPQPASNPHIEQETQPWSNPSHPPPSWPSDGKPYAQHFQPLGQFNSLPQPPSWAYFDASQPWHPQAHPPRHYAHRPPPPRHYPPYSFPPGSSAPPFLPHGMQQPFNPFPHSRTSAPPPYTVQAFSENGGIQTETSENKTLFIGNVGFNVTAKMIQDVFASKGFIVEVDLPVDSMSGKHAGFGYLQFPSIHPALAAMNVLQGFHIDGHAINLEFSDQVPIGHIPASQPSSKAVKLSSLGTQRGSSRSAPVSDTSASQKKASGKEEVISEETVGEKSKGSIKRRKSVTFQKPVLPVPEVVSPTDNAHRAAPPTLIDLADDSVSSAPPVWARSLSPPLSAGHPSEREMIDLGMNRFPPVSQLDAHLLANQWQDRASVPPHGVSPEDYASFRRKSRSRLASDVSVDRATAFGANMEARPTEKPSAKDKNEDSHSGSKSPPKSKRSETVKKPSEYAYSNDFTAEVPLRRRATERDSLRPSARQRAEIDTWARLDRRERLRSRPSSTQSIPGSFPVEETFQSPVTHSSPSHVNGPRDPHAENIDNCVSSLVDMGYGTPEEGGRSRMAVYAAASNGSLLDAIEMIEEERKAYARQIRQ